MNTHVTNIKLSKIIIFRRVNTNRMQIEISLTHFGMKFEKSFSNNLNFNIQSIL